MYSIYIYDYIWLYIIMWLLNPRGYWEPSNICVNIAWCKAVWIAPSQNLWRIFCSRFGSQRSRLSNTIRHNVNLIQSVTWIVQEVMRYTDTMPGRRTICHLAACETSPSLGHTDHEGSSFCALQGVCDFVWISPPRTGSSLDSGVQRYRRMSWVPH